mgnify:CR=1 FL=1
MFFSKFKKPKWQHRSAEVRKEALLSLTPNSSEYDQIILELAADDEADIRMIAIKKLNSFDHIENLISKEENSDVINIAKDRLIQMISGSVQCELSLENRLTKANSFENLADIESILKKTDDSEIKKALLPRITRPSILESMVVENNSIDLQLTALEKISERAALERIIKKCRTKNKKVTKAAKEKLELIIAAEEKPKEAEKQRKSICLSLETLIQKGYNDKFNIEFDRLTAQWQEIDRPCGDELEKRYLMAKGDADKILILHEEIEAKRQKELKLQEQISATKNQLITKLGQALQDLQNGKEVDNNFLDETEKQWNEAGSLNTKDEDRLANQFYKIRKQITSFIGVLQNANESKEGSEQLIQEIDSTLESDFIPSGKFKGIQRKGKKFIIDPLLTNPPQHLVDVNSKLQQLEAKFSKQEQNIEAQRKELPSILNSLEKDLDAGSVKSAISLQKKARKIVTSIPSLDSKTKNRYNALSARASQLQDWKGWATTPKKEELCNEMEALADSADKADPEELAQNIKVLQEQWKKLGSSEPNSSKQLWERFSAAAEKAYSPCKKYYEEQSKQRQNNQQEREAVCIEMEQFFTSTDWEKPDWKQVDSFLSRCIDKWKKCGATDRKIAKALTDRYKQAQENIKSKLNENRNQNKEQKLELIELAKELLNIEDVFQSVERIKLIQKQWKDIGPTFRKDETKIWNEFRSICDQIFSKRQDIFDANNSERNENLEQKNQITEKIEHISNCTDEEFATAKQELEDLKQQWKDITNIPKAADKECYQRFKDACQAVIDKENLIKDTATKHKDEAFANKLELCLELEASLLDNQQADIDSFEARWKEFEPTHKQQDNTLNRRFRDTVALAVSQDSKKAIQISEQNIKSAQLICIKAEIAAGIETPKEFTVQRREYQVNNLADGMKNHTTDLKGEIEALSKELLSLSLIPAETYKEFRARIEKAK